LSCARVMYRLPLPAPAVEERDQRRDPEFDGPSN
jgi:hypothetical protein